MLTAARQSTNPNDFALVAMLGLLGLRIFEATGADITDLGEEHGHRVLNQRGVRMDRHGATLRLRHLADTGGVRIARMHPHMLRHTFVTTMLDAGVDLRDVQIAARHADPRTTMRYDHGPQQPRPRLGINTTGVHYFEGHGCSRPTRHGHSLPFLPWPSAVLGIPF
jgi:integrase/recombinase XerD